MMAEMRRGVVVESSRGEDSGEALSLVKPALVGMIEAADTRWSSTHIFWMAEGGRAS